jgi:predicted MPP superfamily phosphohydrolase
LRRALRIVTPMLLAAFYLLLYMALLASSDPIVRYLHYVPRDWPAGAPRQRLILMSDTHVSGPDTPPARLARIIATIDRLNPDIVLLAGDYISTKKLATRFYTLGEAIRPFAAIRASRGVVAVLGNHDHWADAAVARHELGRAGVILLDNDAVRLGPIALGGVDDAFTDHADLAAMAGRLKRLGGVPVLLSHSPDVFAKAPGWIGLVLAGHTHCGQILLPLVGAIATVSHYGERYRCGVIRSGARTLVVTAGIGTSVMPLRLGAPPDFWVIDVGR